MSTSQPSAPDLVDSAAIEKNTVRVHHDAGVQVDPDDIKVESQNNVIDLNHGNHSRSSIEGPTPEGGSGSEPKDTISGLLILPDLALHSPSRIIGTPFATDAARFEYPFPDTNASGDSSSSSPNLASTLPSAYPSLSSGSSFPILSSAPQPSAHLSTPPSLAHYSKSFPPQDLPTYSPTHPKLRTGNPPVPPGLAKKRHRWSLGLLGRRKSSNAVEPNILGEGTLRGEGTSDASGPAVGDGTAPVLK